MGHRLEHTIWPDWPEGMEPKVVTADVTVLLRRVVRPGDEDGGESVALVAHKAKTSTRTVYRVLAASSPEISLDLADRLCVAAEAHVSACRLVWPDGRITSYLT